MNIRFLVFFLSLRNAEKIVGKKIAYRLLFSSIFFLIINFLSLLFSINIIFQEVFFYSSLIENFLFEKCGLLFAVLLPFFMYALSLYMYYVCCALVRKI
jgi:hypothetical protein